MGGKNTVGVGGTLSILPLLHFPCQASGKACCTCAAPRCPGIPVCCSNLTSCQRNLATTTTFCLLLLGLYCALLLISVFLSPFTACATVIGIVSNEPCECSCYIADAGDSIQGYYHPGAPTHLAFHNLLHQTPAVAHDSFRPWRNGSSHICGQCPVTESGEAWPHCAELAKQQRLHYTQRNQYPYTSQFVQDLGANATTLLACYQPECLTLTSNYFANHASHATWDNVFGPTPRDHLCNIAQRDTKDHCQSKAFPSHTLCA